jgi:hypothetical protein
MFPSPYRGGWPSEARSGGGGHATPHKAVVYRARAARRAAPTPSLRDDPPRDGEGEVYEKSAYFHSTLRIS